MSVRLPSAVADALQVAFPDDNEPVRFQITRYLSEKQALLILDNFEHLPDGIDLLTDILHVSADVKFLVTSRERLNMQEEWVFPVEGLSFPDSEAIAPLETYSAVQLFAQRARP